MTTNRDSSFIEGDACLAAQDVLRVARCFSNDNERDLIIRVMELLHDDVSGEATQDDDKQ
jgi:hypothetical protein